METVGERIKRLRKELKLTQKKLSKKIKVMESSISQWENDIHVPEAQNLIALSIGLETTPAYIISGKGAKSSSQEVAEGINAETAILHEIFLKLAPENRRAILAAARSFAELESEKNEPAQKP